MNKFFLILYLMSTSYLCYPQKSQHFTRKEVTCINVFNRFTNYIKDNIKSKNDITDTNKLKYILINYLFVNKKLDTADMTQLKENELSNEQLISLKSEFKIFYRYFQERENKSLIENLSIIPIRLSSDTFIYDRLTAFQKENTFIFFDKRNPKETLGYLLFIPPIKNLIAEPRIWSWTLMFQFGKFIFKSATGEVGNEYIFSHDDELQGSF